MAELTTRERLQPSLLDRLVDDVPHSSREGRSQRVLSESQLRESVLRDLIWLLNNENFETCEDLDDFPHVRESVLNYGIPTLSGLMTSGLDVDALESKIRQAVLLYEPRILANTLHVRANLSSTHMSQNALSFEIEGDLWAQPLPLRLYLKTEVDLETGHISASEFS